MSKPAQAIKVMLVDDSFLMRSILRSIIKKDDNIAVVAEAVDGEEALSVLESGRDVDVILLDIEMPRMDGVQFMRSPRLKSKARIVVVSSAATLDSPKAKETIQLGAREIIHKPSGVLSIDLDETRSRQILDSIHRSAAV